MELQQVVAANDCLTGPQDIVIVCLEEGSCSLAFAMTSIQFGGSD